MNAEIEAQMRTYFRINSGHREVCARLRFPLPAAGALTAAAHRA
jgi:hypothetical protein